MKKIITDEELQEYTLLLDTYMKTGDFEVRTALDKLIEKIGQRLLERDKEKIAA